MEKDKRLCFRDRIEYFWMYYKLPLLAVIIMVFAVVQWVWASGVGKAVQLSVMLSDCYTDADGEFLAGEFAEYAGLDEKTETVLINTKSLFSNAPTGIYAMTSLSRFYADTGTEKLDVAGFLQEDFQRYAGAEVFANLEELFGRDELALYEDHLYYQDGKPVGIYADGLPGLQKYKIYDDPEKRAVIGVVYNSRNRNMAGKYIEYLSED